MIYQVTWDGPNREKRTAAVWNTFENALSHYERKRAAKLYPLMEEIDAPPVPTAHQGPAVLLETEQ